MAASAPASTGELPGKPLDTTHRDVERVISQHKHALTLFTKEVNPAAWASHTVQLANAYRERSDASGTARRNTEEAVSAYEAALAECTENDDISAAWRNAGPILEHADVVLHRLEAEALKDVEQSIQLYRDALTVLTESTHPEQWHAAKRSLEGLARQSLTPEACLLWDFLQLQEPKLEPLTAVEARGGSILCPEPCCCTRGQCYLSGVVESTHLNCLHHLWFRQAPSVMSWSASSPQRPSPRYLLTCVTPCSCLIFS